MGCTSSSPSSLSSSFDQSELSISQQEVNSIRSISYQKVNNNYRIKKADYDVGLNRIKNTRNNNNNNNRYKVNTTSNCHRMIAHQNLKTALTHPTILKFFNMYMIECSSTKYLSFYLDATVIRDVYKDNDYSNALELMIVFYKKYLNDDSNDYVEIREKPRKLLEQCNKIINEHKDDYDTTTTNNNNSMMISNTNLWIEGIRMAQYEVFFIIQEKFWLPFCESELYNTMIKRKEVRTMISLFKNDDDDTKTVSDTFSGLGLRS